MKNLWMALIYLGFFGLIGFAVWFTKSGWPLWALIFSPSLKSGSTGEDDEEGV